MATPRTRLILIRHGESMSNAGGWISGPSSCGGLSNRGRTQADALRDRFQLGREIRPDVVFSSTMKRAAETAEILQTPLGLTVQQRDDLGELLPGECEGLTHVEYEARYGHRVYERWPAAMSPGGEDGPTFFARVRSAMDQITEEWAGGTICVVCHGGVIMGTARNLSEHDGDIRVPRWQNPENTAISEWSRGWNGNPKGPWAMVRYNDHAHLHPGLHTNVIQAPDMGT